MGRLDGKVAIVTGKHFLYSMGFKVTQVQAVAQVLARESVKLLQQKVPKFSLATSIKLAEKLP